MPPLSDRAPASNETRPAFAVKPTSSTRESARLRHACGIDCAVAATPPPPLCAAGSSHRDTQPQPLRHVHREEAPLRAARQDTGHRPAPFKSLESFQELATLLFASRCLGHRGFHTVRVANVSRNVNIHPQPRLRPNPLYPRPGCSRCLGIVSAGS